jgi:signal transduction histidine kinase
MCPCGTPVIMLTASESLNLAVEFMRMGGSDYIVKPIRSHDMLDMSVKHTIRCVKMDRQLASERNERRAAEEAKRLMEVFIAKISHEVLTPGHQIRAAVDFALNLTKKGDVPGIIEWLDVIAKSTGRLMRLAGDILDLSRMQHGMLLLRYDSVNFSDLIQTSIRMASLTGTNIHFKFTSPSLLLRADGDRLLQVLNNLLSNAIRYTPDDGIISIDAIQDDAMAVCTVSDTGPGIAPEMASKVFDEFTQGSEEHHSSGRHGLGLAICREIVRLHGGTITVGDAVPNGAKFTFCLPLNTQA